MTSRPPLGRISNLIVFHPTRCYLRRIKANSLRSTHFRLKLCWQRTSLSFFLKIKRPSLPPLASQFSHLSTRSGPIRMSYGNPLHWIHLQDFRLFYYLSVIRPRPRIEFVSTLTSKVAAVLEHFLSFIQLLLTLVAIATLAQPFPSPVSGF